MQRELLSQTLKHPISRSRFDDIWESSGYILSPGIAMNF
jgi:hypothetical protein